MCCVCKCVLEYMCSNTLRFLARSVCVCVCVVVVVGVGGACLDGVILPNPKESQNETTKAFRISHFNRENLC